MFSEYRRYLFGLFAVFFVLTTPFLIIYSLGFEINLDKQKIVNALGINIETLPRGANVKNRGFAIGKTPLEMKAADGELVPVEIQLEGYMEEQFVFWTAQNTNASARVPNLTLLPVKPDNIVNFEALKPVAVLSSNLVLLKEGEKKFYVQAYNVGGLVGNKSEVTTTLTNINKTSWEPISETVFWDKTQNILLTKVANNWKIINLSVYPLEAANIVSNTENQLLVLDKNTKLWVLDLTFETLDFLDSGIEGLYYTLSPDNIWLLKDQVIYRLSKGYLDATFFSLDGKAYTRSSLIGGFDTTEAAKTKDFLVSSLFQGLVFKIDKVVYYVPDFNKNLWQVLATDVLVLGTDSNTIFWLDIDKNLFSYNLFLREEKAFGKIDLAGNPSSYKLFYYYTWRRILIYSDQEVYTTWFDKDIINRNVVIYTPYKWTDLTCLPKVIERFQFCQTDTQLVAFKNTFFF